jgi:purine-cytosine permease-like protein
MAQFLLLLVWCLAFGFAIICARFFYEHHRRARPDPERRMPAIAYALVLLVCAVIAYPFGAIWACHPPAGNLCGVVGILLIGPLASALTIVLVGALILLVPSDREP